MIGQRNRGSGGLAPLPSTTDRQRASKEAEDGRTVPTPDGLFDFLRDLFRQLNVPVLIFAIAVIVVLAIAGAFIPTWAQVLVYVVVIGGMVAAIVVYVAREVIKLRGRQATPPRPPEETPPPPKLTQEPETRPASAGELREQFLRATVQALRPLPLHTVDLRAAVERAATSLNLDAIFTSLDVFELPARAERQGRGRPEQESERRVPVMAALTEWPQIVLLGDPGSGKSTLVSFVCLCLAGDGLGDADLNRGLLGEDWGLPRLLPLRIVLRDYAVQGLVLSLIHI